MTGWEALRRHIAAHPVAGTPAQRRTAFDALACATGTAMTTVGGIPCGVHAGDDSRPVVWLHGGGLVFGSPASHAAAAARLAELTGRTVLVPAYRLAPEHPWPAPLEDTLAVIDALPKVALVGDSAGGLLALNVALRRRVERIALISPNTDRTGRSTTRGATGDLMADGATDAALARMAFGPDPAMVPDASPLLADLSGLPPVWITAATAEVLLDDSLLLIRALALAGVPVAADIRAGLCHLWPLWPDATPDARATFHALAQFLDQEPA